MSTSPDDSTVRLKYNAGDPTETIQIRSRFQSEMTDRWEQAKEDVTEWFEELPTPLSYSKLRMKFRTWFTAYLHENVLEQSHDNHVNSGRHWTGEFVRRAYRQGLKLAKRDLKSLDVSAWKIRKATRPQASVHNESEVEYYQTAYLELADQIARVIDDAGSRLREGIGGEKQREWFIDELHDAIDDIAVAGRAHANSTVVLTVNGALLTAYRAVGIEKVGTAIETTAGSATAVNYLRVNAPRDGDPETFEEVLRREEDESGASDPRGASGPDEVQFVTAGDDNVCEVCQALEGTVVDIERAKASLGKLTPGEPGVYLPIHPNCRCRFIAVA